MDEGTRTLLILVCLIALVLLWPAHLDPAIRWKERQERDRRERSRR